MSLKKTLILIGLALFIQSCVLIPKVKLAQNPAEFRTGIHKSKHVVKETLILKRSYRSVIKKWKKNNKRCLAKVIRVTRHNTSRGATGGFNTSTSQTDTDYTPKLKIGKNKAVLSVQFERMGGSNAIPPPGGAYFVVADATRLAKNRTRIDIYRINYPWDTTLITKPIMDWAKGTSNRCPDIQKMQSTLKMW